MLQKSHDTLMKRVNQIFEDFFDKIIPSKGTFISKGSNSQQALKIVDLYFPLNCYFPVFCNMKQKMDAVTHLRQKSQEAKQKHGPITLFIEGFVDKMKEQMSKYALKGGVIYFPVSSSQNFHQSNMKVNMTRTEFPKIDVIASIFWN